MASREPSIDRFHPPIPPGLVSLQTSRPRPLNGSKAVKTCSFRSGVSSFTTQKPSDPIEQEWEWYPRDSITSCDGPPDTGTRMSRTGVDGPASLGEMAYTIQEPSGLSLAM